MKKSNKPMHPEEVKEKTKEFFKGTLGMDDETALTVSLLQADFLSFTEEERKKILIDLWTGFERVIAESPLDIDVKNFEEMSAAAGFVFRGFFFKYPEESMEK